MNGHQEELTAEKLQERMNLARAGNGTGSVQQQGHSSGLKTFGNSQTVPKRDSSSRGKRISVREDGGQQYSAATGQTHTNSNMTETKMRLREARKQISEPPQNDADENSEEEISQPQGGGLFFNGRRAYSQTSAKNVSSIRNKEIHFLDSAQKFHKTMRPEALPMSSNSRLDNKYHQQNGYNLAQELQGNHTAETPKLNEALQMNRLMKDFSEFKDTIRAEMHQMSGKKKKTRRSSRRVISDDSDVSSTASDDSDSNYKQKSRILYKTLKADVTQGESLYNKNLKNLRGENAKLKDTLKEQISQIVGLENLVRKTRGENAKQVDQ